MGPIDAYTRNLEDERNALAAEVSRLKAEVERLEGINSGLVKDFNTMLKENSRLEAERAAMKDGAKGA